MPGALYAPRIFAVAASPTDANVVLVCAFDSQIADGRDGIYRSADGGATWTLVLKSLSKPVGTTFNIVFAPDDAQLVIAVGTNQFFGSNAGGIVAISTNAGATRSTQPPGTPLRHRAIAPPAPTAPLRVSLGPVSPR